MKKDYYTLFYKESENSHWCTMRPSCKISQWDNYAQKQGFVKYEIVDFRTYSAHELHLTTDVIRYKGKYYLPSEKIPYPKVETTSVSKIDFVLTLDEDISELDYDEIYNGLESLDTLVELSLIISDKKLKQLGIYSIDFLKSFSKFEEQLKKESFAIYINDELSEFKWLTWIKDNKVRIIQQYYGSEKVKTDFDILIDKTIFFEFCQKLTNKVKELADENLRRYQNYVIEKYGTLSKDLIR